MIQEDGRWVGVSYYSTEWGAGTQVEAVDRVGREFAKMVLEKRLWTMEERCAQITVEQ